MKHGLLVIGILALCGDILSAQDAEGMPFSFTVYKRGDTFAGYPGSSFTMDIEFKTEDGDIVYSERHEGELDENSSSSLPLGQGDGQIVLPVPVPLVYVAKRLCWKLTLETDEGPIMLTGEQMIGTTPRANIAQLARDAHGIGGNPIVFTSTLSHVTGEPVDVTQICADWESALVWGKEIPDSLEFKMLLAFRELLQERYGLGVLVDGDEGRAPDHNTGAIYADNSKNEQSFGVVANARTWGIMSRGNNGTVGISTGPGNGAGIWGTVSQAPADGGFKYALFGHNQSIASVWAAALFGNGFITGTLTMSYNARLKQEIRGETDGLSKIMQLRPTQYTYRQDTPYGLPDGVQHGFIAQEVEQVFPELVTDIDMPLNTDPMEMHQSGSVQYKGINYIGMISLLTDAIQEMNAKLDAQAAEIAVLRTALQSAGAQK